MSYTLSEDERQIIADMAADWRSDDFDTLYSLQSTQPLTLGPVDAVSQTSLDGQTFSANIGHKECIPSKYLFVLPKNQLHPLLVHQPKIWNPRCVGDFDLIGV